MNNKVNRKSEDEDNKMLKDPDEIYKKTIQTLKKKYGYSDKQIKSEFGTNGSRVDLAIFSKDDEQNPKVIGEIKVGNFVLPFSEYQLKKYMKFFNANYGFLTNGIEWIFYEIKENQTIITSDLPTSQELSSINENKIVKKKIKQVGNAKYALLSLLKSIHGFTSYEPFLQLILFKLYDEKYEKNRNFKKIIEYPETHLEVFENLWNKTNEKYPKLFSRNFVQDISSENFPNILSFSNFSLSKSDSTEFSKILLQIIRENPRRFASSLVSNDLLDFIYELLELSPKDKIVIPYSGPETAIGLLNKIASDGSKINDDNILVIEQELRKVQILKIFSELNNTDFKISVHDPITSPLLNEFSDFGHVIAIPPFQDKYYRNKNDPNISEDYGDESLPYFIKRIITTFNYGTKFSLIVPQGFLFKETRGFKKIRKEILDNCIVKGIIQLPPNQFSTTAIQTSLLLLEVGVQDLANYKIFMSVLPNESNTNQRIDKKIQHNVVENYHSFLQGKLPDNQSQTTFTVLTNDIIKNGWTVTDKIPELKEILEVEYIAKLEDVAEIIQGKLTPSQASDDGTEFNYIRISDIKDGTISSEKIKKINLSGMISHQNQYQIVQKGDILISRTGTIGKSAIITEKLKNYVISSQLIILRPKSRKIIPEFLFECLNSTMAKKQINGISGGIIPSLPVSKFKEIILSVPPIKQQEAKISKTLKIQEEIAKHEEILKKLRLNLQESRDNE